LPKLRVLFFQSAIKALLEGGADPNIGDDFINVHTTAKKLGLNSLQVLYEREEEFSDRLNSRATFKGFTALHYAALTDSTEIIKLLLDAGGDPLIENDLGHRAFEYSDNESVKALLESYEKEARKRTEDKKREERRRFPLEERLKQHLIGQDAAIQVVSSIIRRKENGWIDEEHPLVFLFLGSSGIGFQNTYFDSFIKKKS
jgi:ATP-dependent Clp protease ATP-binding subunit ClpB